MSAFLFQRFAVGIILAAQGNLPSELPENSAKPEPVALHGVVRGHDGEPIAEATVRFREVKSGESKKSAPIGSRVVRTSADGSFSTQDVTGLRFDVRIHAEGHAFHTTRDHPAARTLEVTLERGGAVAGRVLGTHGRGLPEIRVRLDDNGRLDLAGPELEAQTDKNGLYRFPHAPVGTVWVRATAPGRARRSAKGVAAGTSPLMIDDIWMPEGGRISGRVVDAEGKPVVEAQLVAAPIEGVFGGHRGRFPVVKARASGDGRFVLEGVTAGTRYEVRAFAEKYAPSVAGPYAIDAGDEIDDVVLTLNRGATLRFRLVDRDEKPVRELEVHLRPEEERNPGSLSGSQLFRTAEEEIDSLDDGWMSISALSPGRYTFRVEPEAWIGVTRGGIVLADGETVSLDTIRLERGTSLTGRVVDRAGDPIAGAAVRSRWRDIEDEHDRSATSEDGGRFLIRGIPDHPTSLEVASEGFATRTLVEVSAGEEDLVVTLDRHGSIRGTVQPPEGVARRAYDVIASPLGRGTARSTHVAAGEEGFELGELDPGKYRLEVRASGLAPGRVQGVRVRPGAKADVGVVRLGRGISISGRVLRDDAIAAASGTRVRVDRGAGPDSWASDAPDAFAVADADGRFTLGSLEAERYTITLDHPEFAPLLQSIVPDAENPSNEFEFQLGKGGEIHGVVTDADGIPVSGADIYIVRDVRGFDRRISRTLDDGTFRFERLLAGTYFVVRRSRGGQSAFNNRMRTLVVKDGEVTKVEFVD